KNNLCKSVLSVLSVSIKTPPEAKASATSERPKVALQIANSLSIYINAPDSVLLTKNNLCKSVLSVLSVSIKTPPEAKASATSERPKVALQIANSLSIYINAPDSVLLTKNNLCKSVLSVLSVSIKTPPEAKASATSERPKVALQIANSLSIYIYAPDSVLLIKNNLCKSVLSVLSVSIKTPYGDY
ncbi:hypothetical protein, partial [Syntrophomonas zehnderi]|uniref:hypothetical protein n=1 Tax=Syntrophomonas zehnderi TaxID=404335 RepID=UPI001A9A3EF0